MIGELDSLMRKRGIAALLCYGDSTLGNPELAYLTRCELPRGGVYLKKRGDEPLLVVSALDVGSARKGIVKNVKTYNDYGYPELVKRHGRRKAFVELLARIIRESRVRGRVALYGRNEASSVISVFNDLRRKRIALVGEERPTILDIARRTKDDWEIDAIKRAGEKTLNVVRRLEEFLRNLEIREGVATYGGEVVRIGWVKRLIRVWCAEEGLSLPEDHIFAVGPSSADPHEKGVEHEPIREGEPIVFDIFPQDSTGYWFDFTRTYAVGKPSRELLTMFEDVLAAHNEAMDAIREGAPCMEPMQAACRLFKSRGRLTILDLYQGNREAETRGFIHSLGHGIGLTIGEEPYLTLNEKQKLEKNMIATVEPGLYYPEIGGVRLEDVVLISGTKPTILAQHRYELEP